MSTAGDLRAAVAAELDAAGIKTAPYVAESITPPCAVVVPGQPYIVRTPNGDVPFGHQTVRLDVLLVAGRESAKAVAEQIDQLIEDALTALGDRDVTTVSRPGLTVLSTTRNTNSPAPKFVAAVVSLEEVVPVEEED